MNRLSKYRNLAHYNGLHAQALTEAREYAEAGVSAQIAVKYLEKMRTEITLHAARLRYRRSKPV